MDRTLSFSTACLLLSLAGGAACSNASTPPDTATAPAATAAAGEVRVSSAEELAAALQSVQPGDHVVLADGTWTDQALVFAAEGTAEAPITLRPETSGGVVLTGNSNLSISGKHLVASGLHFKEGLPGELSHVVQFRGPLGDAEHCRLTDTQITRYNPAEPDTRYFWVSLYGTDNRVDHCRFVNQNHSGCTVVAWLDEGPARHRIDHNHFLDRPPAPERANGFETMRLGDSKHSHLDAQITVENNLFERCDGEVEVISNKSNENVFRGNTFRACEGTLTLRHGHRAVVEGNYFLGENKKDSGGIRVIGEGHRITGNYIADVDDRMDGALSVAAGIEDTPANGYQQVKDVTIERNTVVRVAGAAIKLDWGLGERKRTLLPERVTVRENLFVSETAPLVEGTEGPGWVWAKNVAFGADLGVEPREGIASVNPRLAQGDDGLWRPADDGPAAGLGASLAEPPLHPEDVGPGWTP